MVSRTIVARSAPIHQDDIGSYGDPLIVDNCSIIMESVQAQDLG
jgi:hypothetical protein